jgi:hypothetical protein
MSGAETVKVLVAACVAPGQTCTLFLMGGPSQFAGAETMKLLKPNCNRQQWQVAQDGPENGIHHNIQTC